MSLSDSCFDFLEAFQAAARVLGEQVHWYAAPDLPILYGEEIGALRLACIEVAEDPLNPEAGSRLVRLAASVMRFHDTVPGAPEAIDRQREMTKLVRVLQSDLDAEDASAVPAIVENIARQTPLTPQATSRLAGFLPKLGKVAYDAAIKIITDIGSAYTKKTLGL